MEETLNFMRTYWRECIIACFVIVGFVAALTTKK